MIKRNIKFPLVMKSGTGARTLEELKENFDLETMIEHFLSGKLKIWLQQRYYQNEAHLVEQLEIIDKNNIPGKLCEIFEVQNVDNNLCVEQIIQRNSRMEKLKQFTDDDVILKQIDLVVFSQDELTEILKSSINSQKTIIYLCGILFSISDQFKNIRYVGINKPTVALVSTSNIFDTQSKNIEFENVKITSDAPIKSKMPSKGNYTIDKEKIWTLGNWSNENKRFNFENEKIFIYDQVLAVIGEHHNGIKIFSIKDGSLMQEFLNIKPICSFKYENMLVVYNCMSNDKPQLCYINLASCKIEKQIDIPKGHDVSKYLCSPDFMDIYDGKLTMYQKRFNQIKIQEHDYNSGQCINAHTWKIDASFNSSHRDGEESFYVYKGHLYLFIPANNKMFTTNVTYNYQGYSYCDEEFEKQIEEHKSQSVNNSFDSVFSKVDRMYRTKGAGKIGSFVIFKDKIITTGCILGTPTNEFSVHSAVPEGYIATYNMEGGNRLKCFRAHASMITDIKVVGDKLITFAMDGYIKVWELDTFHLLESFKLPLFKVFDESVNELEKFMTDFNEHIEIEDMDNYSGRLAVKLFDAIAIYG